MKQQERMVYLDMDGVLADFLTAALRLFIDSDKIILHLRGTWPDGCSINDMLGIKDSEFWKQINKQGVEFWSTLPLFSWTNKLLGLAQSVGHAMILSSPARGGNSAFGKIVWIENNMNRLSREFILTPRKHKWMLAKPGDILVDDTPEICDDWHKAGGEAILFPSPTNGHDGWRDPLESGIELQLRNFLPKKVPD